MLIKVKLDQKFTPFLTFRSLIGVLLSSVVLSRTVQCMVEGEAAAKAEKISQSINSVRNYTSIRVRLVLQDQQNVETEFTVKTVPVYSAHGAFESFRPNIVHEDFFCKEARLGLANLRDFVNAFKTVLVKPFRAYSKTEVLSDSRTADDEKPFYSVQPLIANSPSCLERHDMPPATSHSQTVYGSQNGFGWNLSKIVI